MYILYCSYSTDEAVNKTLKLKKKAKKQKQTKSKIFNRDFSFCHGRHSPALTHGHAGQFPGGSMSIWTHVNLCMFLNV